MSAGEALRLCARFYWESLKAAWQRRAPVFVFHTRAELDLMIETAARAGHRDVLMVLCEFGKIEGLDVLQQKLERLGPEVGRKALKSALKRAAEKLRDFMMEHAPVYTGFLKSHFDVKAKVLKQDIAGIALVGPNATKVYPKRGKG